MSINADELKNELVENKITCCPTCGGPVVVKGTTTKYFVPVDSKILKEMGFTI